MTTKNIWLVPHPVHRYAEDVKALARAHGLIVVDPDAAGPDELARAVDKAPELTLREGDKPKKGGKKEGGANG